MHAPAHVEQHKPQAAQPLSQRSSSEAAHAAVARPTGACTLSASECRTRIPAHAEGRLHHKTTVGPRALIVEFSHNEDGLWLRLPDFVQAMHSAPGHHVTLEISGSSENNSGWVVLVTGLAARAKPPLANDPTWCKGWPANLWSRWLFVPTTDVQGFSYRVRPPQQARPEGC